MKAIYAIVPDKEILQILEEDIDEKNLKKTQILIESEVSIVSAGTELAAFTALSKGVYRKGAWNAYPWRPGYGLVGRVVAAGKGITRFKPGERIFCFGRHASLQVYDIDLTGEMPHCSAFSLDEGIDKIKAVAARMGQVAITAPQISAYHAGDTVAVYGLGTVGNLAAQLFQLGGAKVICLDPVKGRCETAKACGLQTALHVKAEEQVEAVMDLTGGKGADTAVDAAGNSRVIRSCLHSVKTYGEVILLGSPRAAFEANVTDDFNLIHMRSLVVKGAFEWRLPPYPDGTAEHSIAGNLSELLGLITAGKLHTQPLISHVVKPAELQAAYFGLLRDKENYHGVVVDWQ